MKTITKGNKKLDGNKKDVEQKLKTTNSKFGHGDLRTQII
jgi:hypothetical protein